jgi:hypothetical protein
VEGFSAWASSGRLVAYVRAEYQHAPSAAPLGDSARQFIASVDSIPMAPDVSSPAVNRAELLDAYVGMNFENWQVTYGRQSLWWSPMHGGPLMFSDNATPLNIFRINRVSPFKLPWILGWLGEIRAEWFLGQSAGHQFVFQTNTGRVGVLGVPLRRQPFLQGQKLSFKPTRNFEFSISSTTVFSGGPSPLTTETFFPELFLRQCDPCGRARRSWRPPVGVRLDLQNSSAAGPAHFLWRCVYRRRIFSSRVSAKVGIRGGALSVARTGNRQNGFPRGRRHDRARSFPGCVGCYYVNPRYSDGSYVNDGNLMEARSAGAGYGQQAWSTYHLVGPQFD